MTDPQSILNKVASLSVGDSLRLEDKAHDGFGGMVVKRHSRNTLVFQREFAHHRSRWADGLAQCMEEIETFGLTGKLHEPVSSDSNTPQSKRRTDMPNTETGMVMCCAFALEQLDKRNIAFLHNSFRGDYYARIVDPIIAATPYEQHACALLRSGDRQ